MGGVGFDWWQTVGFSGGLVGNGGWMVEIFLLIWVGGGFVDFCSGLR